MTLQTVQLIHFDTGKLDEIERRVRNLRGVVEVLSTVRVQPDEWHWDEFSAAVRSSEADIVVPVLHGTGTAPEITFATGAEPRHITDVFEAGPIMAPTLAPLICTQHPHVEDWRRVAPHSRLVLARSKVYGVANTIRRLVQGRIDKDDRISSGQAAWCLHDPSYARPSGAPEHSDPRP